MQNAGLESRSELPDTLTRPLASVLEHVHYGVCFREGSRILNVVKVLVSACCEDSRGFAGLFRLHL